MFVEEYDRQEFNIRSKGLKFCLQHRGENGTVVHPMSLLSKE
jgi:hypothetical protein